MRCPKCGEKLEIELEAEEIDGVTYVKEKCKACGSVVQAYAEPIPSVQERWMVRAEPERLKWK